MTSRTSQLLVSLALLALGIAVAVGTWMLPNPATYAQVGPRLFPGLIAGGLILISLLLVAEAAFFGGFKNTPEHADNGVNWAAFIWATVGVGVQMALVGKLGFILTGTFLFYAVTRAFGSTRHGRNLAIGFVLAAAVFFLFTRALTLQLPWGDWLPEIPGISSAFVDESAGEAEPDADAGVKSLPGDAPADAGSAAGGAALAGEAKAEGADKDARAGKP